MKFDGMTTTAIRAEGPTKRYGSFDAPGHVGPEVPEGEVLGYLGLNGAFGAFGAVATAGGAWALQHRDPAGE
jgi:hypothetical protein